MRGRFQIGFGPLSLSLSLFLFLTHRTLKASGEWVDHAESGSEPFIFIDVDRNNLKGISGQVKNNIEGNSVTSFMLRYAPYCTAPLRSQTIWRQLSSEITLKSLDGAWSQICTE